MIYRGKVIRTDARKWAILSIPDKLGTAPSAWAEPIFVGDAPAVGEIVFVTFNKDDVRKPIYWPKTSPGGGGGASFPADGGTP